MASENGTQLKPDAVRSDDRIGGSGFVRFGGRLYNMADYNPALQGQKASETYEEMLNDSEIAAGISRLIWPLLSAQWTIEPVDDSDEEKEIAEFCEKWILGTGRRDPFAPKWQDLLRHSLLCLSYGFSAFEKVWGVDEDGRQVYAQIAGIMPKSVRQFVFKTDGSGDLDYLFQYAYTDRGFEQANVPAAKLMVFTFAREADNLWGRSILRACYKPWYHEEKLTKLDGMRHERHGLGFTIFKISPGGGNIEKDAAELLVREARAHEKQYAVIEVGQELSIDYPTGQGTDILGSIKHHNTQKAQVLFSEFMHLGSSQSGSRAVSTSKIDFLLAALQGVASLLEDTWNTQAIVELVARNYGARTAYPRLNCEDLSKLAGTAMAETLAKFLPTGAGAITPNADLEQHLRETYQLPLLQQDVLELMQEADRLKAEKSVEMLRQPTLPTPAPTDVAPTPPANKVAASEGAGRLSRDPLAHEAYFAAAETSAWLDREPDRIWYRVVAPYRKAQIEKIATAAPNTSDEDFKAGRIDVPLMKNKLTRDLAIALDGVYMRGRSAILAERDRQLSGQPLAARSMQESDDGLDLKPTKAETDWVEATASLFVTGMVGSLVAAAQKALGAARNVDGATKRDQEMAVRDALTALSVPVQIANLGGAVNRSYGNGRNEQAASMAAETETAFYSAIMDAGTCGPCAALDGEEHDPGDPTFTTPNPACEGDWRCRCVTIYVFREVANAA